MNKKFLILALALALLICPHVSAQEKYRPVMAGPYRVLFQPDRYGDTINDHTVFPDRAGSWRMFPTPRGATKGALNIAPLNCGKQ